MVELERAEAGFALDPDPPANDRFRCGLRHAELRGLTGHTDEAVAALERLVLPPGDAEAPIIRAVVRATLLLESGRAAESAAAYEALLAELASDGSHLAAFHRAIVHVNLALALSRSGRTEEAVALVEPTIAEYEALAMPTARVGNIWIEFVSVYRAAGRMSDAHRAAEQGVALLERGDASPERLARARAELAAVESALREQEVAP